MFSEKGIYADTVSYFCSPYHVWCCELGYPELDVVEFKDGEKALIQYHRSPVIPALTPWNYVLTKIRNVDITPAFIKHYADKLNLENRHVWDEMDAKDKKLDEEQAARERHDKDIAERRYECIRGNDALMQRISRNGLGEMNLRQMARHIPNHHYRK